MLSAEELAAVKVAVELCNGQKLKREILLLPVTYGNKKPRVKKMWDENLEKKATVLVKKIGLGSCLQERVTGLVLLIGMRMLIWAKYHECLFGISRDFSIDFLKSSLFTSRGIIDNKKAAEELIKCQRLNDKQRYKVASLYCFPDQISNLLRQISKEDQMECHSTGRPFNFCLANLWHFYQRNHLDKLINEVRINYFLLEITMESGIQSAVEYCLERMETNRNDKTMVNLALKTVNHRIVVGCDNGYDSYMKDARSDWMVFRHPCSEVCRKTNQSYRLRQWNPNDHYIDILCLLFKKMSESQQIEFLIKDNETRSPYSGALYYFLFWPYQNYFMKAINLTWDFLPEWIFVNLLIKICDKIEPRIGTLKYGEGKTFSYRKLLKEFWVGSPQRCKRYLFSNKKRSTKNDKWEIFTKIFLLKDFTNEDQRNIELILDSASDKEMEAIVLTKNFEVVCLQLIEEKKWKRFDFLVSSFHPTKMQADSFKKKLCNK